MARNGIADQSHSAKDTTNIENCVKGWGQGAFSSRVFDVEAGIDNDRLALLISHLEQIALEKNVLNGRITADVLGTFVQSQRSQPYSTWDGERTATTFTNRAEARFRAHIQWQGFLTLCGQLDRDGVKHVTPELLRQFFDSEQPFFQRVVDRRHELRTGATRAGDATGILADVPDHIDREATDRAYEKNKSGLVIVLNIARYMVFTRPSKLGSL